MNIFKNSLLFAIIYFNTGSIFAQNPRAKVFITTPVISLQNAAGTNSDQVLNVDFKIEDKSFNTSGNFISTYKGQNLNNSLIAFSDIDFNELSNINIPVKLTANTADGNNSISDKINYTLPLHNLEFDANNKFNYTNTTSAGNIWTIQFRTDVDYYFEGELKLKQTHYRIKSTDKIPTVEIIPAEGIQYQWQNGNAKGKVSGSQGQFYTPSPEEVNKDKSGMYYISVAAIHPGNKEITSEASRIGIIVDPSINEANVLDCPEIATAIASPSSTCGGTVNLSITTIPNASGGSYVEGTNYFLKWYLNGVLILNGLGADNSFGTADDRYNLRNTTYTVPAYSGTQCGTQDLIFTAEIYCLKTGDSTKQGNPRYCDNTAGNMKKQFGGCGTTTFNGYTNGCAGVNGSQGPTGMGNYFNPCTGLFNFTTFQTCSGNPGAAQFLLDLSVLPACSEVSRVTYDVMGSSNSSCNSGYSSSWASEANLIFYSPDANPTTNNSPGSFLWSNAGYTMCGTPDCNQTGGSFRFNRTLTFPAGTSASGIWRLVLFDDYNDGGTYADGEVNYVNLRVDYYMSPACLLSAIPGAVVKLNTNTIKLYDPINVGGNFTIPGACETAINPICSNLGILYSNNNGGTYTLSSPPTPVNLGQTVYYQAKYISPGAPPNGCPVTGTYTITGTSIPANAGRDTMLTCSLTSVKIGSPAQTGKTYSWTPVIGLDNPLIAQPTVNLPGTYYLTLTDTTTGCFGKDTIIVSGDVSIPVANAGLNKTLTCSVTSVPIGIPNDPNNTYTWSPANGLNSNLISNPIATAPGTYTLTVKNIASGCTATDQVTIAIDTIKPFANAGTDKVLTCANTVFVLGTNNVPANSYAWTPAAGLNNPAIANPRDSLPNTYYLTVTNNSNGCIDKDTVVVTQNITPPIADAGPNQLLNCYDKVFVLGIANDPANTYKWTPISGLNNPNIAQPRDSLPNRYQLLVRNIANGCVSIDSVVVTQDISTPIADAGRDSVLTCITTQLTLGTPAISGNTYAWTPTTGLFGSGAATAQPSDSLPNTFYLTVTKTVNGCTAKDTVKITQNIAKPVANAGTDKELTCANTVFVLGTNNVATNSYTWTPAAGLNNPAIANPRDSLPNTYYLTVTNNINGCIKNDTIVVTQNITPPVADAGPNQLLNCYDKVFVLGIANDPANTYKWTPISGLNNPNIAQPRDSLPNRYQLLVRNIANGCVSIDSVVVTQDISTPIADAGRDSVLTCITTQLTLGTPAISGNTYAWTPTAGLFGSGAASAQPSDSLPNTFYLTVTKTVNGCTAKDTVKITQNIAKPVANAGTDKVLTCANTVFVLGTNNVATNTYSWTPAAGLNNSAIANPRDSVPNTYYLTVTNNSNGCIDKDTVVVTQNITPPIADAGLPKTLTCANPVLPIGTPEITGNSYTWLPVSGLSALNIAQPNVSKTGTFTVMVTDIANGCKTTDSVKIDIDTIRPFADAGNSKTLTCAVSSVQIGTPQLSGNTYLWTPTDGLDNPSTAQPRTNTFNNYTVTVTRTSNGCKATSEVMILQNITTSTAIAGNDLTLTCKNLSLKIGDFPVSGNSYLWSPSNGLDNPNISNPTVDKPGTYSLTVTNLVNGCTTNDVVNIRIDTIHPKADAGLDKTLNCRDISINIGTNSTGGNTYSWAPGIGLNNTLIAQPLANKIGTYTLTVTKTSNGCTATDDVNVLIDTVRPTAYAGDDQMFGCPHLPLTLGTISLPNTSYLWTTGLGLSDNNIAQPTTDTAGTYVLVVTNTINHCKSSPDTVVIYPKNCDCTFYVPTAFSPNNDGINDILSPLKDCDDFTDFSFSIFNRWGELVFKSNDISIGWDGIYKSESMQDSFLWTLEYFDILYNTKRFQKGVFVLLK